jgi:hypothetical protein
VLSNVPPFVHRDNADGTTISFCRTCFMTVASSHWEAELERAENIHKCDPIQLAFLASILNQESKGDRTKGAETLLGK